MNNQLKLIFRKKQSRKYKDSLEELINSKFKILWVGAVYIKIMGA